MPMSQHQVQANRTSLLGYAKWGLAIVLGLILGAIVGVELALRFRLIDIC